MVWKALEALGMLSEALGSFDVNTVCPLPGLWINHVMKMRSLLYASLQGLLNPVHGNVVFLVQDCTRFTKVSCFSIHFCSRPSQITWFACKFVYICVILCVGSA